MSSTTASKKSTTAKKVATPKKVIKPLNPSEFNATNVEFSNVITNTDYGTKSVNVSYINTDTKEKQLRVAVRGCVIKTFGKVVSKDDDKKSKSDKYKREKYQVFMAIKDENFIKMIQSFDEFLVSSAVENSKEWLGDEMNESECRDMLKSTLPRNEKYGSYALSAILSTDFTCKSKTDDVPDVSDLSVALAKNTVIDVCVIITKVKLSAVDYRVGMEISQINIISVGAEGDYVSNAITPESYEKGQIKLSERKQHEKGGRFCKVNYADKGLRIRLENIAGRIIKFEKEDTVNYSIRINLSNPITRKMFEDIDQEIFDLILANSKELYDSNSKKTAKQLKNILKPLVSFSKEDQEKIKNGKKPDFEPSIWIKLYYSDDKGFDGKITNLETSLPFDKTEDIINKDVNIANIEFYSRHVWFGPKGTSTNLTLNKCEITYDVPIYDMDDAPDNASENASESDNEDNDEDVEEAEEEKEEEPANSDDE
jgi:hypothetical protein